MRFETTALPPACRVIGQAHEDARGLFMRLHCEAEFGAQGLPPRMVQTNLSRTTRRGTIRGLHFQQAPSREGKLVRCVAGAIYDVIVDLRPDSEHFLGHTTIELDGSAELALFVPPGFAHGFQTLTDDAAVLYQMTDFYAPEHGNGVRWDDPALGVTWPIRNPVLSERDATYPDFTVTLVDGFRGY